ncbi:unnamed protein product [Soboliphyme baturini]|uniref:CPSF_A domain-containing protein n=1 Tax=Soboliphyme baturini TaxID=241478 RepID=A0A183J298_9BILA|nr:unnamed protein product [Soboliphyme baturini]
MQLRPRVAERGAVQTYLVSPQGDKLELIHETPVDEVVVYFSFLDVTVLYANCTSDLLTFQHIPYLITNLMSMGQRIYVSDVQESVFFVRYKQHENQLIIFADDTHQRFCTATCLIDFNTVAVADKFGNIAILRLQSGCTDDVQEDPTGIRALWDKGLLNGASQKSDTVAFFHVGETITCLQKVNLIPGGSETLTYTTLSGSIGALVPFTSREDHEFFQHLEMHMRSEFSPLCGRDHLMYRSYMGPVKNVIDGDLCEQFSLLEPSKQASISEDLDRNPSEVMKKLEDIRTRYAF